MNTSVSDRIEKTIDLKAPVARVWGALTDYRKFGEWFGVSLESPFVVGKSTRGNITYPGYEHLVMEVKVVSLETDRRFAYHWHPYAIDPAVDYSQEPPTLVQFTLEPIAGGTRLTIVESGFDKVPAHRRDEAFRMNSGGWAEQMKNIDAYVTRQE